MRYFSIHGSEKDGWRLMVYDIISSANDTVSPAWSKPKEYDSFKEVQKEIKKLLKEEEGNNE